MVSQKNVGFWTWPLLMFCASFQAIPPLPCDSIPKAPKVHALKAYSQSIYPKGQSNKKRTTKDYFGFLLHFLFHDYSGLVYNYN